MRYYAYNTPLGVYLREKSLISLTNGQIDADSSTVDTLYRVDMVFAGGYERDPSSYMHVPEKQHFYIRDEPSVENVSSSHRVYYPDVWDDVDVHFHHGALGAV